MAAGEIYVKAGTDSAFYWRNASDTELSYTGGGATSTALAVGTIYVTSTEFFYVAGDGLLRSFGGSVVGTGGTPGEIFVDSSIGSFRFTGTTGNRYSRT